MFGIILYLSFAGFVTVFIGVGYYLVERASDFSSSGDIYEYLSKRG